MEIDAKTSLIISLIKMAQVDGHVSHAQQMNITILSDEMGVEGGLIAMLKQNLSAVSVVVPKTREKRVEYFWRVLTMMKMDMQINEKAIEMGKDVGIALQFTYHETESIVAYMVANVTKFIKLEMLEVEIFEIIKRPKLKSPKKGFMKWISELFGK